MTSTSLISSTSFYTLPIIMPPGTLRRLPFSVIVAVVSIMYTCSYVPDFSPSLAKDISCPEKVQSIATKVVKGLERT